MSNSRHKRSSYGSYADPQRTVLPLCRDRRSFKATDPCYYCTKPLGKRSVVPIEFGIVIRKEQNIAVYGFVAGHHSCNRKAHKAREKAERLETL